MRKQGTRWWRDAKMKQAWKRAELLTFWYPGAGRCCVSESRALRYGVSTCGRAFGKNAFKLKAAPEPGEICHFDILRYLTNGAASRVPLPQIPVQVF
ncbi:hypothetical protein TNIN_408381 [Trichonephila inaurata madagascariensis]|uniref:Uncharacterized protein n=1 Tax=Trichonephila inaurata madagascariensis TaxID=2747483 RepID=A0A8X6WQ80_9ARAC|nr:hypothetical protein TNIN_408381 [Trichonephila inaurata madagascariensis]